MTQVRSTLIEVYPFRRRGRRVEFLALRRARDRSLPGVWQPVTGRRAPRESALAAARRELLEETGNTALRWWALETITLFYDPQHDCIQALPLFAAELPGDAVVRLSAEHDDHRFLSRAAAAKRFLWDGQRRGLAAVQREVLNGGPLADALSVFERPVTHRRRTGGRPLHERARRRT